MKYIDTLGVTLEILKGIIYIIMKQSFNNNN